MFKVFVFILVKFWIKENICSKLYYISENKISYKNLKFLLIIFLYILYNKYEKFYMCL